MKNSFGLVTFCALALPPITALAQTPSFSIIGSPGNDGRVTALSSDGSVAAGWLGNGIGFTWTSAGGRNDYGLLPGVPSGTISMGLSDNGVVVGEAVSDQPSFDHAFRWAGPGTFQDLGVLPGFTRSQALGVSGDGSVAVGLNYASRTTNTVAMAFRWTQAGGMQQLGFARQGDIHSEAKAVSRDGGTVVGFSENPGNGTAVAFSWTQSGGMQVLPGLAGSPFVGAQAFAVNFDGSIIAGVSGAAPTGNSHPVLWRAGAITDLGLAPGYFNGFADAVSSDGVVAAGTMSSGTNQTAFVWTASSGTMILADYLTANGVQVPAGFTLTTCLAVAGDGKTFAGYGQAGIEVYGFVASIPAPSGIPIILVLCCLGHKRRRSV